MTTRHTQFDIFISYARKDNVPIPIGAPVGWVTALRDHILADHRRFSTEPLNIFFDTDDIRDMDDWWHRILGALRSSRVLLVCLSPNYFASEYCRKEWEEYRSRQVHQLIGSDSIARVYFVEVPGADERDNARWLDELMRANYTDVRPWFPEGAAALQREEVLSRMAALGESLWERIDRARRAGGAPGNLRRQTPFFVGRQDELRRLHERVGSGAVGVVTAMHGLGGQGKTELAVAYAHGWADHYPAGLWALEAEHKTGLIPLIGELAYDPRFEFTPPDSAKDNPALLGHAVLAELKRRATILRGKEPHGAAAALLLLDNVSEPVLLSAGQLALLPAADWLRIVATTRLGPDRLAGVAATSHMALLPVDSLAEEDALALLREHQPLRDRSGFIVTEPDKGVPRFATAVDEAAALKIVRDLGSFTLAVEQVAIYLGMHPEITPGAYLAGLRGRGLPSADEIPNRDATAAEQMLHQQKQLAPILASTLAGLDDPARTALEFAALLPPDTVPWPWLQLLTTARFPELEDAPPDAVQPWQSVRRRLTGLRLLTPGNDPEITRIHRLVAAHIAGNGSEPLAQQELESHLVARAWAVYRSNTALVSWELDALLAALPPSLAAAGAARPFTTYRDLANAAILLSDKVKSYRSLPGAASLLESARVVLERLAASDAGNAEWQRDLCVLYNKLGDLAVSQGDLPGAQRWFTDGMVIAERLAASDAGNAGWQRDLSVSYNKLGDLAMSHGDLPGAKRWFTDGMVIAERLAASDAGNAGWQRDLSVLYDRLGDLAVSQGDLPGAQRWFTDGMVIRERLAASDASNAKWQRDLSVSYDRLGNLAVSQGDLPGAKRWFTDGMVIRERLAASDAGNAGWQRDLSVSYNKLGDLAMSHGDLPGAKRWFTDGMVIRERLAASDAGNAGWQRDLSVSYNKLGDLAVSQGDLPGAKRWFTDSMVIAERLAASDAGNAGWQRDLWVSYWRLADLMQKQAKPDAVEYWRKAQQTLHGMKEHGMYVAPQDVNFLDALRVRVGG